VEWNFVVQHPLNKEPVVFVENQYQDDQRYWIGATVTF
jgi:iron complex outermembrane recepter protein